MSEGLPRIARMGIGTRGKDYGAIFIYALTDPRDGRVRYVGKARDPAYRLRQHELGSECAEHHRGRWLALLRRSGLRPGMIVLEAVGATEWREAEARWILQLRAKGCDLVNGTNGGDGLPDGYLRSGIGRLGKEKVRLSNQITVARRSPDREWACSFLPYAMAIRGLLEALVLVDDKPRILDGFDPGLFRAARYYARLLGDAHHRRFPKEAAWATLQTLPM